MARPKKQGIDYFPLDIGFLEDIKVRKIMRACGAQSIAILIGLLGYIYRDNGYFIEWDSDLPFLIADTVGVSEGAVDEIVRKALQVDFFDMQKFDTYGILTSSGIQKRFFRIAYERKKIDVVPDYLIENRVNRTNNSVNRTNNSVNRTNNEQRKEKKSKVKKSISISVGNSIEDREDFPKNENPDEDDKNIFSDDFDLVSQEWVKVMGHFPSGNEGRKIIEWINAGASPEMLVLCIRSAEENDGRTFRYIQRVVENTMYKGGRTAEDFINQQKSFEKRKARNKAYKQIDKAHRVRDHSKEETAEEKFAYLLDELKEDKTVGGEEKSK